MKHVLFLLLLLSCGASLARADAAPALAALPPMVSVAEADLGTPVSFDVPRGDLPTLVRTGAIAWNAQAITPGWRFTSHAAAMRWFDAARPLPPTPVGQTNGLARLGDDSLLQGPLLAPDGRVWFWNWDTSDPIPIDHVKRNVASACHYPKGREVVVAGAEILWIDRRGRVWLLPYADHDLLLGYDPATRSWMEHRRPKDSYLINEGAGGAAFESRNGTLFFPDKSGVHVLQGDRWSYQAIPGWSEREDIVSHVRFSSNAPRFTEDGDGKVYVWEGWVTPTLPGTDGYWVFDGAIWTNVKTELPVSLVLPRSAKLTFVLSGDKLAAVRDGVTLTGWDAEQAFDSNISFKRAFYLATDAAGTSYLLLTDLQFIDPPIDRPACIFALPARGAIRNLGEPRGRFQQMVAQSLPGGMMQPLHSGPHGWLWGVFQNEIIGGTFEAAQSRTLPKVERFDTINIAAITSREEFYLRSSSQWWRFDPANPHLAEATVGQLPAMRVRIAGDWFHDSLGRLWCAWNTDSHPLAIFDGRQWTTRPGLGERGFISAFPGNDGSMILEDADYAFHLYDKEGAIQETTAALLASKHWDRVSRALTYPPLPALDFYSHLAKDGRGDIWWSNWFYGWGVVNDGKAFNGLDLPLGIDPKDQNVIAGPMPLGDGGSVFVGDEAGIAAVVELRDGNLHKVSRPAIGVERDPVSRDSKGNVWVMKSMGSYLSQELDGTGKVVATHPGHFVFEDGARGLWFTNLDWGSATSLTLLDSDGTEATLAGPDGLRSPTLAADGSVWALSDHGLLHIARRGKQLAVIAQFTLPVEARDFLWADPSGRVWQSGGADRQLLLCYAVAPVIH